MSNVSDPASPFPAPMPAVLSYLVPGLGQIVQGRVAKGVLFMVCVYTLFFYGWWLGSWRNVYLPQARHSPDSGLLPLPKGFPITLPKWVGARPQFVAQFWMGIVVWPALYQNAYYDEDVSEVVDPWLGECERTPPERELNELQINGDKTWDLGWVFTVIAGALNVLVIYDALAGPAFILLDPAIAARKPVTA